MPSPAAMTLDTTLITTALTDPTQRPRARSHLQAFLAASGAPDQHIKSGDAALPVLVTVAEHGWAEAVTDLLAAGANVHADNDEALRWAALGGYLPVVECLLAAGADVHAQTEWALRTALRRGDVADAASLLRHGADAAAAWTYLTREDRNRKCAAVLDALAAAIPRAQCRDLLRTSPCRFPRIRSMLAAEQRCTINRPHPRR